MFGRKARKIRELEEQLLDALENLACVTLEFPGPARASFEAAPVRKGAWYRASIEFQVADDGNSFRNVFLGERPDVPPYFDGGGP